MRCAWFVAVSICAGACQFDPRGATQELIPVDAQPQVDGAGADAVPPPPDATLPPQPACASMASYARTHNGHTYRFAPAESVVARVALSLCLAEGAYPAVINDQAEDDFVDSFPGYGRLFIGAFDVQAEGDFTWITDDAAFWVGGENGFGASGRYTNWDGGEPNDAGTEDCVEKRESADGQWNDQECDTTDSDGNHGYVCECDPNVVFVRPPWLDVLN